ncbi:hypothetical protein [Nannocystis bainbridge]|uniref:Uncharacterized protein n=1 Tax=Nannocystis bainbridge TaxID=2995303 RepID=A0ABT5DVX1_9BACT|nr:hypothetical protein [Nannocystis bainbridge]MDC0717234.1 hypothetical protein [Nannocystis bainbridge]
MSPGSPRWTAVRAFLGRHAYVALAAGALLVLTRTVDFAPPPLVRPDPSAHGGAGGPVEVQEFSPELRNPRVMQLRLVLRRYDDPKLPVKADDHALDDRGDVLSSPLVTAVVGTEAAVDQKVGLEGGDLQVRLGLRATPRLGPGGATTLEHTLEVHSERAGWRGHPERPVFVAGGVASELENRSQRWVFAVDDHLFSLDLEAVRPGGPV